MLSSESSYMKSEDAMKWKESYVRLIRKSYEIHLYVKLPEMTHSTLFFSSFFLFQFILSLFHNDKKTEGFVEREIKKDEIPVNDILDGNLEAPASREMIELESTFEKLENELKEVIASRDELKKTFLDLTQLKCILQKAQIFFHQVTERDEREEENLREK